MTVSTIPRPARGGKTTSADPPDGGATHPLLRAQELSGLSVEEFAARIISVSEAASMLGIDPSTGYDMVAAGSMPGAFRVPGTTRLKIFRPVLEAWILRHSGGLELLDGSSTDQPDEQAELDDARLGRMLRVLAGGQK